MSEIHESVKQYYGKELANTSDLKTNVCCTISAPPANINAALKNVHDEVVAKYYGCGLTIPKQLEGMRILDLGSGSGRDCYIAAQLVGEKGAVVGVDMTDEQLEVARRHEEWHRERFGYEQSNITFLKGNIENLDELALEPESFDIIISNCVINLASNKEKVLQDAYKLLKEGGEMYFSDVYADRRIPQNLKDDQVLWGECLSGALYWNDFLRHAKNAGFIDPRSTESKPIEIGNPELEKKVGNLNFYAVTYRMFKMASLEADCEDYGQAVAYQGTIEDAPMSFDLDDHHHFPKGKIVAVCGNTFDILNKSRFKKDFQFFGDTSTHFGIFEGCGTAMPFNTVDPENSDSSRASCC